MNKSLLCRAAALLLAPLASAQQAAPAPKATPAATPPPRPQLTDGRQLIQTGSFDKPKVTQRTPASSVKDLLRYTHGEWTLFGPNAAARNTGLIAGLTNEVARTGKQAVYFEFDKVKKSSAFIQLSSGLIPVKPSQPYHISLWGRMDAARPIILDQRVPVLRLQVDYLQADGETQTGDPVIKVQPIPGTPNRPLFFTADRWTEFWSDAPSPEDAAFVKVTWSVGTTTLEGETDGVIYFDDLGIIGERVAEELTPDPAPGEPAPAPADKPALQD